MSWLAQLHKTYEQGLTIDQSAAPFEKRLMPVSHTLQNAHIKFLKRKEKLNREMP
ncbi:MAG: hypothetical protein QTN59_04570 [Candidatus Electrothrix communis]|nr:MAG: hypothetical protein QTN59_04570 [Candidatus Electrothrix communis]